MLFYSCMAVTGLLAASCSSSQEPLSNENTGLVRLSVNANATFGTAATRAVNEEDYKNTSNYHIRITSNASGNVVKEYETLSAVPESIELDNGAYTLTASYGEAAAASRTGFYVEGSSSFNVQGEPLDVSVACAPTCGKVVVNFDRTMADYFSDYSVVYSTKALTTAGGTAVWAKDDTEPWYLTVDKEGEQIKASITIVRQSDSKASTIERTYTLAPNKAWTLNIAPKDENGNLGIEITIDESTEDHDIDIVVPSDWI